MDVKRKPKAKEPEIELEPDAWDRFERFIKSVAKAGPQHKAAPPAKKPAKARRKAI